MDWTRKVHLIMIRGTTSRSGLSRNPRATVSRVNGARTRRLMFGVTPLCLRGSIALESVVASVVGNVRGTLLIICVTGVRVLRLEIGRMVVSVSISSSLQSVMACAGGGTDGGWLSIEVRSCLMKSSFFPLGVFPILYNQALSSSFFIFSIETSRFCIASMILRVRLSSMYCIHIE